MKQSDVLLIALTAAGENATLTPVQLQKLFFLLDKEAAHLLGGPHFNHRPYDYGPFDSAVYNGMESLAQSDRASIVQSDGYRVFSLTEQGFIEGKELLHSLPASTQEYLKNIADWVRQLSFQQLVASIYNRYPEMKINSVFRG
jgi:uncharacterized protein